MVKARDMQVARHTRRQYVRRCGPMAASRKTRHVVVRPHALRARYVESGACAPQYGVARSRVGYGSGGEPVRGEGYAEARDRRMAVARGINPREGRARCRGEVKARKDTRKRC